MRHRIRNRESDEEKAARCLAHGIAHARATFEPPAPGDHPRHDRSRTRCLGGRGSFGCHAGPTQGAPRCSIKQGPSLLTGPRLG